MGLNRKVDDKSSWWWEGGPRCCHRRRRTIGRLVHRRDSASDVRETWSRMNIPGRMKLKMSTICLYSLSKNIRKHKRCVYLLVFLCEAFGNKHDVVKLCIVCARVCASVCVVYLPGGVLGLDAVDTQNRFATRTPWVAKALSDIVRVCVWVNVCHMCVT